MKKTKAVKKKDENHFKSLYDDKTDAYKYDMTGVDIKALNEWDFEEEDTFETKYDDDKIQDNINKLKHKLNHTESGYNKKNKNIDENGTLTLQYVYYYSESDKNNVNHRYHHIDKFKCTMDTKIEGLSKRVAFMCVKHMVDKSKNRESNMEIDTNMENHYKNKQYDCNDFVVYFIKYHDKNNLIELFKTGKFLSVSSAMNEVLVNDYIELKKYISNSDNENVFKMVDIIINVYKNKIKSYGDVSENKCEKWIKSIGEFWCLVTIIIVLNMNTFINVKNVPNAKTGKFLEMDFYINDLNIAVEINGKQHEQEKQKNNDRLKNAILEKAGISLISFDSTKLNSSTLSSLYKDDNTSLYNNIASIVKRENNNNDVISRDKFEDVCKFINKHVTLRFDYHTDFTFTHNINDFDKYVLSDDDKKTFIHKKYIENKIVELKNTREKYDLIHQKELEEKLSKETQKNETKEELERGSGIKKRVVKKIDSDSDDPFAIGKGKEKTTKNRVTSKKWLRRRNNC
jgi:hypothetical protein